MTMKDRTKLMFAEALEKILETKPFDKVRVLDLCKLCETTPQTFYYHFHDKYELAAWVFLHDFASVVGGASPEYSPTVLTKTMSKLVSRREFYKKALNDHSQNAIGRYMFDFTIRDARAVLLSDSDAEELTKEQITAIKYHTYGIWGLFRELIFETLEISLEETAAFLYEKTPDFMKAAYAGYSYKSDEILDSDK